MAGVKARYGMVRERGDRKIALWYLRLTNSGGRLGPDLASLLHCGLHPTIYRAALAIGVRSIFADTCTRLQKIHANLPLDVSRGPHLGQWAPEQRTGPSTPARHLHVARHQEK